MARNVFQLALALLKENINALKHVLVHFSLLWPEMSITTTDTFENEKKKNSPAKTSFQLFSQIKKSNLENHPDYFFNLTPNLTPFCTITTTA